MSFVPQSSESDALRHFYETEDRVLAGYAMRTSRSRGRRHRERPHPYRPEYVRDRDRIIHSASFRRLIHKTQVFVGQPDDHQRTRLTHTLEVAQIARTIARNLKLNEDLTEAIALAHDLGHPPFGHAGERALAQRMAGHGGFDHNRQGLRLLDRLEDRYPAFPGLNLSYEVLESMALRSRADSAPELAEFRTSSRMLAESQAVDAADSIAYSTHDIDDALRARLISFDDLHSVELWRNAEERARSAYGENLTGKQLARGVIRALIDWLVGDVLAESTRRLVGHASVESVRAAAATVVALSDELATRKAQLEQFLLERVYRHEQVVRTVRVAERMISQIFDELVRDPALLPDRYVAALESDSRERVVCDYIATMTDRFAQSTHRELFEP
jgi:dGTPase